MNIYRKKTLWGAIMMAIVLCAWLPAQNHGNGENDCGPVVVDLLAGQYLPIGTVTVTNDVDLICVTYALNQDAFDKGWRIYEIHLAIGAELADIPQTRANRWGTNPIPGLFPYTDTFDPGVEETTICVPLQILGMSVDDVVYIAAHAVVMIMSDTYVREETAWGKGVRFNQRGNWGMYLTYRVCDKEPEPLGFAGYIGYEDLPYDPANPRECDYDYNDFGMDMIIREVYTGDVLREVFMAFQAICSTARHNHDIHLRRPLYGTYTYTVQRSHPAKPREIAAGNYSGGGMFDVVVFDTQRWSPASQPEQPDADGLGGEWVEIHLVVDEANLANTVHDYGWIIDEYGDPQPRTTSRWDLAHYDPPIFKLYQPWLQNRSRGNAVGIESWLTVEEGCKLLDCGPTCVPDKVPAILVVPRLGWVPPAEAQPISEVYPYFCTYYDCGAGCTADECNNWFDYSLP